MYLLVFHIFVERITILESGVFGGPQKQVHEFTDLHDGEGRWWGSYLFVFTSFLLQHKSPSNISKGQILPSPLDLRWSLSRIIHMTPGTNQPCSVILPRFSQCRFQLPLHQQWSHPRLLVRLWGPTNLSPLSSPPAPIPSQTISPSSSWGLMMTPGEVQELLAPEPQTGEYYVVTKGRRPGVYLSWWVFQL